MTCMIFESECYFFIVRFRIDLFGKFSNAMFENFVNFTNLKSFLTMS